MKPRFPILLQTLEAEWVRHETSRENQVVQLIKDIRKDCRENNTNSKESSNVNNTFKSKNKWQCNQSDSTNKKKNNGFCFGFQKGNCRYGNDCKLKHEKHNDFSNKMHSANKSNNDKGKSVCRYFQNHGICRFGNNCKFSHQKRIQFQTNKIINNSQGKNGKKCSYCGKPKDTYKTCFKRLADIDNDV